MTKICEICEALNKYEPVYKSKHWNVGLSPDQAYFGRCYVSSIKHVATISDLTMEQWTDLHNVMKKADEVYSKEFGATVMNWGCLTNHAFQTKPYNPHVHWHLRPRYDHEIEVAKVKFSDPEFGHHYNRERTQQLGYDQLQKLHKIVKNAFKKH